MTLFCNAVSMLLLCGVAWSILPIPTNTCITKHCPKGFVCVEETMPCYRPPCSTRPVCRRTTKPGSCPRRISTYKPMRKCRPGCSTDANCPGNLKCCGRCPRRCTAPVIVKPGRCPRMYRRSAGVASRCHPGCHNDGECKGRQKCCSAGICGNRCMMPRYVNGYLPIGPGRPIGPIGPIMA